MTTVDLYYDFRSPFSYFASQRLSVLTSQGAHINWCPVSVDVLLNLQVNRQPWGEVLDPMCDAKRDHFMADIFRMIEYWDITFSVPSPIPPKCNKAMAIAALLKAEGSEHSAFRQSLFKAVWQEQKDPNDISVLQMCLDAGGHEHATVQTAETVGMERLTEDTLAAFRQGVFGVPSFVSNGQLYFGADRMDVLAVQLQKQNSD